MSLVNEHSGHNKTSHATHSHQQSNVPSRASHNFIGHNKHNWCPAFAQTPAASGCLNTGLLPPQLPLSQPDRAAEETSRRAEPRMLRPPALAMEDRQDWTEVWSRRKIWAQSSLKALRNVARGRRPFTLLVRSSRGQNMTVRPALAIHHPQCCPSSDIGHPSPLPAAFYLVFLFLYFCRRQHGGPTCDLHLGAFRKGSGILFIHVSLSLSLSPSSGRLWLSFPTTWN